MTRFDMRNHDFHQGIVENSKHIIECVAVTHPSSFRSMKNGKPSKGDDRVGYRFSTSFSAFYLADGATGIGLGGEAAEAFSDAIMHADEKEFSTPEKCAALLRLVDEEVAIKLKGNGDTTGIVLVTDGHQAWGASAGDSEAILYRSDDIIEITAKQVRKPRFGNGAKPTGFSVKIAPSERILIASDGLWDFSARASVAEIVRSGLSAKETIKRLEQLIRSRNEERLPDDLGMILISF